MATHKVFVDEKDEGMLVCPHCGQAKRVNLSSYRGRNQRNMQAKCSCQSRFPISLEYRRFPRRETSLDGHYMNLSGGNERGEMKIINYSYGGVGLINLSVCRFSVGDRINLNFTLDDENKSEIDLIGVVKHMNDRYIGCDLQNASRIDTPS